MTSSCTVICSFNMYLSIHNSDLFSLLSLFDFLYLSFKGSLQTFCLLLPEIMVLFLFVFFKNLHGVQLVTG